jgi:FKBP-type peptidyl-prolyl cis-trans isomerase FkpA
MSHDPADGPPTLPAGVVTERLESGLEYAEVARGEGPEAQDGSNVRVRYLGWLTDGTLIDGSPDESDFREFALGDGVVIRGLNEGICGMRPGGHRRLIIPADLAYGSVGDGSRVPPYETLIYDVILLALG